jgi:hypothetical protein
MRGRRALLMASIVMLTGCRSRTDAWQFCAAHDADEGRTQITVESSGGIGTPVGSVVWCRTNAWHVPSHSFIETVRCSVREHSEVTGDE